MSNAITMAVAALLIGMIAAAIDCTNARLDELDGDSNSTALEPRE